MIRGIGTDIVEIDRIGQSLKKKGFKNHVFSVEEQKYCEAKSNSIESYAGKFVAKESFLKALGIGLLDGIQLIHIEIINDQAGKPDIKLNKEIIRQYSFLDNCNIRVSISHTRENAIAFVTIEDK